MSTIELHRRALDEATDLITSVTRADLGRATPCTGWDLGALLAHMVGQNHGFADAVDAGSDGIGPAAFAPRPVGPGPSADWRTSADRLASAFAGAPATRTVSLPEISPGRVFPLGTAAGFQLLDTVVHTWDVATTLGRRYRPADDLVDAVLAIAGRVPDGPRRSSPGAEFAPGLHLSDPADPWLRSLALLGRRPPEPSDGRH